MRLTEYLSYLVLLTSPGALARAPGYPPILQYSLDRKGSTAAAVDSKAKASTKALCTQYMDDKMNRFTESCNIVVSEEQISITLCSSDDTKAPLECEGVERFVDAGEYEIEGGLLSKKVCIIFFRGGMMYVLCSPSIGYSPRRRTSRAE